MESLSLVERVLVEQWNDSALNDRVLGNYPYKKEKYVDDGPYGYVRALPPDQVLSGLGVPFIGFDNSPSPKPSVLTAQPHSDTSAGAHTVEEAVANGAGTLSGYVDRKVL